MLQFDALESVLTVTLTKLQTEQHSRHAGNFQSILLLWHEKSSPSHLYSSWNYKLSRVNKFNVDNQIICMALHVSAFRVYLQRLNSKNNFACGFFFKFWFVRLLTLRPLLAYCASLGW
jgi:hypothetical protein